MTYGLLPGAEVREVAVEGVRYALSVAGPAHPPADTTPVLLLHGVPQSAVAFRFLLPELAKDRRVLAPDLKGLGESEVRGPYDVATVVRELAALVLHEVDGPVDVVGHDWGGSIAIALAVARPDLVRRLVVVDAPYRYVNFLRAFHIPLFSLPVLPELVFRLGGRRLIRVLLSRLWKADGAFDPVVRTHYERVYTQPERVRAMLGYYRDNTRPRLALALRRAVTGAGRRHARPPRPAGAGRLVVWGTGDPVLRMDVAEAVVRELGPDTRLVAFPGVGHFPLEEAPDDVVPVVAEFLRGRPTPVPVPGEKVAAEPAGVVEDLAMPVLPANKASGRDPDAQRASGRRRAAEVRARTAERAAARRANRPEQRPAAEEGPAPSAE